MWVILVTVVEIVVEIVVDELLYLINDDAPKDVVLRASSNVETKKA